MVTARDRTPQGVEFQGPDAEPAPVGETFEPQRSIEELQLDAEALRAYLERLGGWTQVYSPSSAVPTLPDKMNLGFLPDRRLRVIQPIQVQFIEEDDQVIAEAYQLNEFGYGESRTDALHDLQRAIVELHFALEEDAGKLGKDLNRVRVVLGEMVKDRSELVAVS